MSGMEIPIAMMVAGSAVSAGSQIMAGQQQARSAEFEQQQMQREAEVTRINAANSEAAKNREFVSSMNTVEAIRAGRGIGLGSPSSMALLDSSETGNERDIRADKLGYMMKADSFRMGAQMAGEKAKYSLLAGYMGAGSTLLNAGANAYMIGSGRYPIGAATRAG
jgi:hypothetical protein